jgi:hypothetical protein
MMAGLKLPKLPDRTPVKLTISISPGLHDSLGFYAEIYAETYGTAEPVQDLIPAMLASFLESDRAFILRRKKALVGPQTGRGPGFQRDRRCDPE